MDPILELRGISKSFPGVKALAGIDLSVNPGEIHALLGENGAGKSTLMKVLSGIIPPDEGHIVIAGEEKHFGNYHDAVAAGIGIVFQEFSLIPYLNAVENIFLGRERRRFGLLQMAAMRAEAVRLFERLGVSIDLSVEVRMLSVAQQQFIEIAKALALDARILILDEPTATLTPTDAEHLFIIMRALKQQGVAMIFISHHMEEIFEICDRITVLRDGQFIGVTPVVDTDMDSLVQMMVGRRLERSFPPKPPRPADAKIVLEVEDLEIERGGPVNSFRLHEGEILGFSGLVGSGRTETVMAVLGADPAYRKTVRINGEPVRLNDPAAALSSGLGILPESRKVEGLITSFSIRDNISINNLGKYKSMGAFVDFALERTTTADMMKRVGVKAPDMATTVETLSGGNQQKVVLARWLNHHCKILFFDEPTRGIDVGAKAEIYTLMRQLTERGYAIIMVSSELPEIVGMSDRVAVFREGRIVRTLEAADIAPAEIMRHATAGDLHELV
ncbi:sugar ABC transporter ATP-binding protein [Lichenicola sp.]|uniref:sugar ABC transporter ATP-binding protein n=1 Tax=Lichenicola sp. TaxID=2804529 RepID=UPI003B00EEAC